MAFISDSFTDTAGTLIDNHTGEIGATWTKHPSFVGDAVVGNANRLRGNSGTHIYIASGTPATNEYDVEAAFYFASTGVSFPAITGRMVSANQNYYRIRWNTKWQLMEGNTILAEYIPAVAPVAGDSFTVKLEIRDATKKVYIDGVERISSATNGTTQTGSGGVIGTATNETFGQHLDNFTATDVGGGGTTFTQAIAATAVGTAALVAIPVYVRSLAVSATGTASFSRTATYLRSFSATATGTPVLTRVATYLRSLSTTALGTPSLSVATLIRQALSATAVGTAALSVTQLMLQVLSATATGTATLATRFIEGVKALGSGVLRICLRIGL